MAERALPTLPEEVIIDCIMVRIPAKSVGRFRCVSKPWRSFLSSPRFAQAHLNIHKHEQPEGIILSIDSSKFTYCTVNMSNVSSIVSKRFNCPSSPGYQHAALHGSCNGLVLVDGKNKCGLWSLNLFNPITLETLEIRESGDNCSSKFNYDLGYDSLHDDYKILSSSMSEPYKMGIYSVKMGTWRSLGNSPYQHFRYLQNTGLFVNGYTHWPAASAADRGGDTVLAAFSLAKEKYTELPLPKGFVNNCYLKFIIVGGCIAMIEAFFTKGVIVFWVMKEYGVQDSWTEYAITTEKRLFRFVGVLGEDEILFTKSGRKLVSYNWRTGVWRDLVHSGKAGICRIGILETRSFRESLISPNYGHSCSA